MTSRQRVISAIRHRESEQVVESVGRTLAVMKPDGWASIVHMTGTAAWMDIAAAQYLPGVRYVHIEGARSEGHLAPTSAMTGKDRLSVVVRMGE